MKKTLKRISPLRFGIVLGALYALLGVIFVPLMMITMFVNPNSHSSPIAGIGMAIFMVIIYPVMGFIGGVIVAALYNLIVPWTGGIEVEVE